MTTQNIRSTNIGEGYSDDDFEQSPEKNLTEKKLSSCIPSESQPTTMQIKDKQNIMKLGAG